MPNGVGSSSNIDTITTFLQNISSQPIQELLAMDFEESRQLKNAEIIGPVFHEKSDSHDLAHLKAFVKQHSERLCSVLSSRGERSQIVSHHVSVSSASINKVL